MTTVRFTLGIIGLALILALIEFQMFSGLTGSLIEVITKKLHF